MLNNIKGCAEALRETAPEIDILINEPMRRHTTFSIGGPADLFILPKTRRELIGALEVLRAQGVPMLLLGNGSNILVSDEGVRGAVVCTSEVDEVRVGDDNTLTAEAGALLSRIARRAQRAGLTGAEFAGGIPGSLGGAVFMNAGAYDGQMAGIVESTEYLDAEGNIHTLRGEEHGFGYRRSIFRDHPDWTVLRSVIRLQQGDSAAILNKMNDFSQRRRDKQPLNFRRPAHLQAPRGIFRRKAHRGRRTQGRVRRRGAGFGKARRLSHQPGRRDLRRHAAPDRAGAGARSGAVRRRAGVRGAHCKINGRNPAEHGQGG